MTGQTIEDGAEDLSFPKSVIQFMLGTIGEPPGGFPEPLRSKILKGAEKVEGHPGESLPLLDLPLLDKLKADLEEKHGQHISDTDVMSSALYPKVLDESQEFKNFGLVDKLKLIKFIKFIYYSLLLFSIDSYCLHL